MFATWISCLCEPVGANIVLVTALENRCWSLGLMFGDWLMLWLKLTILFSKAYSQGFFKDPSRVHRIETRVPRIRENYHRVPKIRENRVPTGSYRVPIIFLKKCPDIICSIHWHAIHFTNNKCCQPCGFPAKSGLCFVELRVFLKTCGLLVFGLVVIEICLFSGIWNWNLLVCFS